MSWHFTLQDRKSTRLNSSHVEISYAVFCLKKKRKRHCLLPAAIADQQLAGSLQHGRIHSGAARSECSLHRTGGGGPAWVARLFFFLMIRRPPRSTLFLYTTLFR